MSRISPCLWFSSEAEEAAKFYVSLLPDSRIEKIQRNTVDSPGGKAEQCGWLKDRYGVSWQIVPTALTKYLGGADTAGAQRAMQAMLGMVKLDIEDLKRAYEGKSAA